MIPVIMMVDTNHVSVVDKIDIKMLFWELVPIVIKCALHSSCFLHFL